MRKPRRPHGELKPEVVALANQQIEAEGVSSLNARGLAAQAGCSVGTLYNLFDDLDGIVRAVNHANLRELELCLLAAVTALPDDAAAEARMIAMAEAYFDFALSHPHSWEAMFRYRASRPKEDHLAAGEERLFRMLQRVAEDLVDEDALRVLWSAVHGVTQLALSRKETEAPQRTTRIHARLAVEIGLRGAAVLAQGASTASIPSA